MSLSLFDGLPNPLTQRAFAVMDFETTGLYPAIGDEIVELGVVRVENGVIGKTWSRLVNPLRPMDPTAAQISRISPEMLAKEPPFAAVIDEFLEMLRDAVIVCHNAEFDMAFLQYKLVREERQQVPNPVLDTLELARAEDDSGQNTLGILANRLGIEGLHAHRALDDAMMTAKVLLHFLEEYHRRGQDDLNKVPGYRNSFQFSIDGPNRGEENSFKRVVEHVRVAIESSAELEINYRGGSGQKRRRIVPRSIKGMSVRAYCLQRKEEMDFRLDRILEVEEVRPSGAVPPSDPLPPAARDAATPPRVTVATQLRFPES
jgi:DNA polymerase-3 subunit epsilon